MFARKTGISSRGALGVMLATFCVVAQAQVNPKHVSPPVMPPCLKVGQQVTLTLNTGSLGPIPTADPIWTIVSPATIAPFSTAPNNAPTWWLPNTPNPKWIQPDPSGAPATFPLNTYIYQTQFTTPIDPFLYASITISGSFASDDNALVKLNGIPIASCTSGPQVSTACFHIWTAVPAVVGWQTFNRFPGYLNALTIDVANTVAGSTSGLLVRAQVIAVCSKCSIVPPVGPPQPPCGGNPSNC